jgi:hypothetical protein
MLLFPASSEAEPRYDQTSTGCHQMKMLLKLTLLLAMMVFLLFGFVWYRQSGIFRECEAALLSLQWMLLACLAVWCGSFLLLTFNLKDLPLVGLLLIAIIAYFIGYVAASPATDAIILLACVTLGKGARFFLKSGKRKAESGNISNVECGTRIAECVSEFRTPNSELRIFLVGLVLLLTFSSWWHLDMAHNFYPGTRWTGLWDNPNDYGMLMGAGLVLTIGLLSQNLKSEKLKAEIKRGAETGNLKPEANQNLEPAFTLFRRGKSGKQKLLLVFLLVAAAIMGVGLVMSYSRGAWVGTAIGLLYLAKAYGKLKWRFVLPGVFVVATVVFVFWRSTADTGPWYLKRMDLSRASAQHRVSAWRGALQMMRDHPFGIGWNKAVGTYEKNYSPPEGSAAAITTNDYLMLGTQLGFPGLLCFIGYIWLCFRRNRPHLTLPHPQPLSNPIREGSVSPPAGNGEGIKIACRAGALAMLVAFWFDGGLFKLATASVFWILLELGTERQTLKTEMLKAETNLSLVTSAATK